jgi:hypothetical protein
MDRNLLLEIRLLVNLGFQRRIMSTIVMVAVLDLRQRRTKDWISRFRMEEET